MEKSKSQWYTTMIEKHGSVEAVREVMSARGKKGGGKNKNKSGGFAAWPTDRLVSLSRQAGRISRRKYKDISNE